MLPFDYKYTYKEVNMKLSDWARKQGIHYNTAYRWFKEGKLPVKSYQTQTNTIMVEENQTNLPKKVAIYCRVSSYDKNDDLLRQARRCEEYCHNKGYSISKVYKEIASGMNDKRNKFWKMVDDENTLIVCENKDRLTRFGFNYIERLGRKCGISVEVINQDKENEPDLIKDMIAVMTSFCCRLYGARRGQNKSKKMKEVIHDQND